MWLLSEEEKCRSAAGHCRIDCSVAVKDILYAGYFRMCSEDALLKIVAQGVFPFFNREGKDLLQRDFREMRGNAAVGFGGPDAYSFGNDCMKGQISVLTSGAIPVCDEDFLQFPGKGFRVGRAC